MSDQIKNIKQTPEYNVYDFFVETFKTRKNIQAFMKVLDDAWTFDRVEFEKSMKSKFTEGKHQEELCTKCEKNSRPEWNLLCDECRE